MEGFLSLLRDQYVQEKRPIIYWKPFRACFECCFLVPRQHYSAALNIIQQPSISVSLQVGLLATMLSLSVSGLSLASTYSQIETLRRDSNALSKAIAGLAVTTGRSFPSQFEELISEGKYLIIYSYTIFCLKIGDFWPPPSIVVVY